MNNREINETRTKLLMKLAEAGRAALEFDPLAASALAAIPNTNPQQYVAAGTLKMIAKVLPSVDAPAAQAQSNLVADLSEFTDRSIREHADFRDDIERLSTADSRTRKALRKDIYDTIDARVRNAVKAALSSRAGSSDVRDKAQWISMSERRPEDTQLVLVFCPDPEPGMWPAQWMADSQTFESRENGWVAMNEVTYWMPLPALPAEAAAASNEGGAA